MCQYSEFPMSCKSNYNKYSDSNKMHITTYNFSVIILKASMPYNTNYNKRSFSKTNTHNVTAHFNVVYCMFPGPINVLIPTAAIITNTSIPTQPISMLEYFNVMIKVSEHPTVVKNGPLARPDTSGATHTSSTNHSSHDAQKRQ